MSNSIKSLPTDSLATIGSFLSEEDLSSFSLVNKTFNTAARDAQLIYHYPEIQLIGHDSYLGRIAQQPLMDTEEGRIELVRRVRQIAEKHLRANLNVLQPDDWQTLGVNENAPVSDFTYKQINMAGTIIDRYLLRGIYEIPILRGLVQVGNSLSQNAAIIRNCLANTPNCLGPNGLRLVLCRAVRIENLALVQAILQSDRAIHPEWLGRALSKAVGIENLEFVQTILQSGRAIHPTWLGIVLCEAVEIGNLAIVQAILRSEHAIGPRMLGWALSKAEEIENPEIVQAIRQSGREIEPL